MNKTFLIGCSFVLAAVAAPVRILADDAAPDTRYGLFNMLDHRSFYNEGNFPEPFLVDDSGLEINEARLDWLHTETAGARSDKAKAEIEKGFGLATLELEVPYERNVSDGEITRGFDNVNIGARCPFFQYVSAKGFFDITLGAAIEAGIPVNSAVSKNAELVPKIFSDTRIGENFTIQSVFGHSFLFGPGEAGGTRTFEYGMDFGYSIQHKVLPVPCVLQVVPIFEFLGETALNKSESGRNSVLGNAAVRINFKPIGRIQPRIGVGFVFPLESNARADVYRGIITSFVFEY